MILKSQGKEYHLLEITTDPATAPTDWEASYDDEETWTRAVAVNGMSAWLLAREDAADKSGAIVISADTRPVIRLQDSPEVIIRDAPRVYVE